MNTNDLLTKSDELLDKIARLELEASLIRCKAAVDRLLTGLGPNRDTTIHTNNSNCPCGDLELKDFLLWNADVYSTYEGGDGVTYKEFTFKTFSIRRFDGSPLNWDRLIDSNGETVYVTEPSEDPRYNY